MTPQIAIVGNSMECVVASARLRRAGISVKTFLSGSTEKQRKASWRGNLEYFTPQESAQIPIVTNLGPVWSTSAPSLGALNAVFEA